MAGFESEPLFAEPPRAPRTALFYEAISVHELAAQRSYELAHGMGQRALFNIDASGRAIIAEELMQ